MMTEFSFNAQYMTKNNKPWFPIMGEIHYTRYPKKYWKEALYKMKAGGVEVVSTYVIWIHHEEIEGEYDFTGNRDLRSFVEMCKECGLYLILRIGPWVHGEVRNGGFPDWLLQKGYNLRSNDAGYLAEVEKYDKKLQEQVKGLLLKEGGPIIGLQIENELGHCGGACGEDGENHMKALHRLALEIGFDVPIYTATGWGGAVTGGLLPVMGGYCEAPWDQRRTEIEPSGNYIFTYERNDHNIGSDYGLGVGVTFDYSKFPYLTAELGGGMQVTHHRRPIAEAEDIGAMTLVKLGSGVNLLGYYMYHGGTNPKGKKTTLQESRETGYPNDLPKLNYDFCAPIREYGQVSDTLKEIKLYAMFIQDFGSELCKMPAYIPENNPVLPTNFTDLRYSVRHNGHNGYLFINNYQRRYQMEAHDKVNLSVDLDDETIAFPSIDIKDKDYYFLPFHMPIGTAVLKSAAVTPLCIVGNETKTYIFYGDKAPSYDIEGDLGDTKLITLSREDARNAWKVKCGKEHLIISESAILQTEQGLEVIGRGALQMKVYPDFDKCLKGWVRGENEGDFTVYRKIMEQVAVSVSFSNTDRLVPKKIKNTETKITNLTEMRKAMTYDIELNLPEGQIEDCFLIIAYQGDRAKLYLDGELVADHFYTGRDWEIGMKRFDFPGKLQLEIDPLS
ncbi:MAG: beta-galactosidase, partial [Mobilitalea sp.]